MEYRQVDFCRIYGLDQSTVSKAVKRSALVKNTAGLIDDENATNKIFMAKHRLKSSRAALEDDGKNVERIKKKIDFTVFDDYEISQNTGLPQKLLGMTIRELVTTFKGMEGLETYIKMLRDLAAADEKDQKTQERRLQLVDKDFIVARLFQYLDVLMKQLLEYPKSAVDSIVSLVQAEGEASRQEVVRKMETGLSAIIKGAKEQMTKELSGLRAKYQKDDSLDEIKQTIEEAMNG
jgi:hypothetical protein